MENATNALRIAGGVLLAMLVLSLIVWGIRKVSRYEQAKKDSTIVIQTDEFNKPLLSFENSIVSGFNMVSIANLANDNNVRYSEIIDAYIPVKIYAKLINTGGQLPGWTSAIKEDVTLSTGTTTTGRKYFNMMDYVGPTTNGPYYIQSDGKKTDKNTQNEFKQLYFQCVDVKYDNVTGRVIQMVFEEIRKRN